MELDKKIIEGGLDNTVLVEAGKEIQTLAAGGAEVYSQLRLMLSPMETKSGKALKAALREDVMRLTAFLAAVSCKLDYYTAAIPNEICREDGKQTSVSELYGIIGELGLTELLETKSGNEETEKKLDSFTGQDTKLLTLLNDFPGSTTMSVILYSYSALLITVGDLLEANGETAQFLVGLNNYLNHQLTTAYSRMDMNTQMRFDRGLLPRLQEINKAMLEFQQ